MFWGLHWLLFLSFPEKRQRFVSAGMVAGRHKTKRPQNWNFSTNKKLAQLTQKANYPQPLLFFVLCLLAVEDATSRSGKCPENESSHPWLAKNLGGVSGRIFFVLFEITT